MTSSRRQDLRRRFLDDRGVWSSQWESLLASDADMFEAFVEIRNIPHTAKHLSSKLQEFIYIVAHASATTMYSPGVQEHVMAALAEGATREEILEVIGLTSLVGIHTITVGVPILVELVAELGLEEHLPARIDGDEKREQIKAQFVEKRGYWSDTWDPVLGLDPDFFEAYMRFSSLPARRNVLPPKVRELLYCAFDAATTHLFAPGIKIHMRNALQLGVTPPEIMEMLELVSFVGMNGVVNGAAIVDKELAK